MSPPPELWPQALNMVAALAVVLGGMFLLVHVARRYLHRGGPAAAGQLVRTVASHPLGIKKSIALVEVPGCVLVLGLSGDRIQVLTRIQDPGALERIRSRSAASPASFTEQLARLGLRRPPADREE
jgi:flagellar protein FliO/FliZ